ncbi:arylsulfatase [bacterium]|nr:arylsulfatase [bacterium]
MAREFQCNRREALKTGLAGSLALTATTNPSHAEVKTTRPNILLLMADQFRGDCIGADRHPCIKTPNLDRIANEGVLFKRAYSSTPTCTPARAALLTGLSPWNHGMLGYYKVAPQYPYEMPRALREAGYYTLGIGKMHFHHQRVTHGYHKTIVDESGRVESPAFRSDYRCWFYSQAPTADPDATGIGWNSYKAKPYVLPEHLHPTRWTGDTAVHFIDQYDREEPFFLKVSFARPHSPYDAPKHFWDLYDRDTIPAPHVGDWAERHAMRGQKVGPNTWRGDLGVDQAKKSRHGYYANITFIDEQIGRMLDSLEQKNLLENTLILFIADHGDMTGDHHMWRKSYAYEGSARIPMLMRWPKGMLAAKRGQVLANPVEIRDVFPTFLHAANAKPKHKLDGQSLLHLAAGDTKNWRDYLDLEHDVCYSTDNHWNALTDGRMKYIYHAKSGEEQLFDLDTDPGELHDLAKKPNHQSTLKTWRERMVDHLAERGETFVKNGKLTKRPKRQLLSPNYPRGEAE